MTKVCFKCNQEKAIDDFYAHPMMADGHLGKCKDCTKKDMALRGILKRDQIREYDKKRYEEKERKESIAQRASLWRKKHPEKARAHTRVARALKSGKLIKPELCEICGQKSKLHAHHEDYSKPLEVVWICPACHGQIQ